MQHKASSMVLLNSVSVYLMSKVPTLAPPACTFEFDQVSVTEALKAARMG